MYERWLHKATPTNFSLLDVARATVVTDCVRKKCVQTASCIVQQMLLTLSTHAQ